MKRNANGRLSPEAGFSLVELMIVLVFIAIGIMALSAVQTSSFTDVYSSGMYTRALDLAQTRIETARAVGYSLAQADSGTVGSYNWVCLVDSAGVSLNRVTATVSWVDKSGPRSVRLVSLLSDR
jgi:prepilin-type N-terminal cleavage/methylation domain-containing protein